MEFLGNLKTAYLDAIKQGNTVIVSFEELFELARKRYGNGEITEQQYRNIAEMSGMEI